MNVNCLLGWGKPLGINIGSSVLLVILFFNAFSIGLFGAMNVCFVEEKVAYLSCLFGTCAFLGWLAGIGSSLVWRKGLRCSEIKYIHNQNIKSFCALLFIQFFMIIMLKSRLVYTQWQEFSSDMGSRTVKRIGDVSKLRIYQFPQVCARVYVCVCV